MAAICSVCLDPLDATAVALPGCGHRFHLACALTCAQRDARCPNCRQVPEDVSLGASRTSLSFSGI